MPEAVRKQLAALLDSADNPKPEPQQESKQEFIDSFKKFETLTQTDSQIKPHLPEGTNEVTLAKEVAKLDQGQSILEAEQQDEFDFSTILDVLSDESAELIHAAIACQLAGMTKPAKLLFRLFTQRQFIDANKGYQALQEPQTSC